MSHSIYSDWRTHFTSVGLIALLSITAAPSAIAADIITVTLDQAKIINLPAGSNTVIIGNPIVADLTLLPRNNQVVLTGKGFGETNLIALDANGGAVGETIVRVVGVKTGLVVQRGMERETYHCAPRCEPTVQLGTTTKFMQEISGQISARNSLATPTNGAK